jgi:GGDEF domain-containing protein/2'-5' RNA ligase
MGATEPEGGRPVLQASPRPEVNQAAATAEHPAARATIEEALKPVEGAKLAGARPEKEAERTEEKIAEGQTPRTVRDYSGFRVAVDSPAARDAAEAALARKFEIVDRQDEWERGNPESGFHGLTLQVREPGSPVSHEVQILPREVEANADSRHELYEKARGGSREAQGELRAANEEDYRKFAQKQGTREQGNEGTGGEPKFKFGSTQANIPADSEAAQALKGAQQRIAPEDRAGDVNDAKGGLVEQPHVTLRYGIKGEDTAGIRAYLERQAPFEATLGPTDTFPPSEHSDGAAAVIAPVEAPELRRIEAALDAYGDFAERSFPEYKPHATLGYVKPEAAAKYKGMDATAGRKFLVRSVSITDRNGNAEEVPLKGERRQDVGRRARVAEMTPEAMRQELLTSEKTGLPNRRAYEEAQQAAPAPAVAMSDADGLKALNDRFGYAAGDALLKAKAEALEAAGVEAYHDKGDEFLYRGQNPEALAAGLERARENLRNRVIEVTMADGSVRRFKGADFSYGTGSDQAAAEAALKQHKSAREQAGERARGELRGIAEVAPGQGEEPAGAARPTGQGGVNALRKRGPEALGAYPGGAGGAGRQEGRGGVGPGERGQEAAGAQERRGPGENQAPLPGTPKKEVAPAAIGPMDVSDLHLAPGRFQYKLNTGEGGATDLLRGQRWNPKLAGVISVWRDPADGKVYVVNGHHRVQLAREQGVGRMNVQMLDEPDAAHARATGALQNIAAGRGTELDAAKFFRDTGWTAKDLAERGVSLRERTAADGMALSRLAEPIFDRVVSGQMRMGRALAVARAAETPEAQEALLGLIRRQEMKGKRVADDTVEELGRMVRGAGEHAETQQTLFGEQEMRRNLALEKAEVSAYIRDQIGREKRLFGAVATRGRAETLGAAGNVIEPERNAEVARSAAQAQEFYDRLSTRTGAVDDALNQAAKELAEGKDNPNAVKQRAYDRVRGALAETLGQGQGPGGAGAAGAAGNAGAGNGRGQPGTERAGAGGGAGVKAPIAKGDVVAFPDGRAGVVQHAAPGFNGNPPRLRVRMADGSMSPNVRPQDVERVESPKVDPDSQWIGVDLDGTLAHYDGFKGQENIGRPVPAMVDRVKALLADGRDVRIFTARVSEDPGGLARSAIEAWSREHLGRALPVTDVKDDHMERLYDDRAVAVERNTGQIVGENGENGGPGTRDQGSEKQGTRERGNREQGTPGQPENRAAGGAERPGPAEAGGGLRQGAPFRGSAQAQAAQERLLAAGRFKREIEAARRRSPAENAFKGKPERIDLDGAPALRLDAHAYEAIHKTWFPETSWPGAFLDEAAADGLLGELRASESNMRQKGMSASADAMGRLAGAVDAAREPDGSLVLLRADADEPTIREELAHRWHQQSGLRGSAAMRAVASRPEFEAVHAQLIANGYHLSADDAAAEIVAKALAGDPAIHWEKLPELQGQIVEAALKAAVDEEGAGVLDTLPARHPAVREAVERAREYGGAENHQGRAAGAARRVDQEAGGAVRAGEPGEAAGVPPRAGRGPGGGGAESGNRPGGAAESELTREKGEGNREQGGLFARRLPGEVPLPGMEGAVREQDEVAAEEQGRELAARMLEPKGDISRAAGEMERLSPLFRGTEAGGQGELFKRAEEDRGEVTESQPFKDWFGKSKAVGRDGKPRIVYHGTARDFDTFDPTQAGSRFERDTGDFGRGIYFADRPETAERYAISSALARPREYSGPDFTEADLKRIRDDKDSTAALSERARDVLTEMLLGKSPVEAMAAEGSPALAERLGGTMKEVGEPRQQVIMPVYLRTEQPLVLGSAAAFNRLYDLAGGLEKWMDLSGDEKAALIRKAGYDSVHDTTYGQWEVFDPHQVKSALGNSGAFSRENPNILFSREPGAPGTEQERGPEAVERAIRVGQEARRLRMAQDQLAFGGPSAWQRAIGAFRSWRDQTPDAGDDVKALIRDTRGQMDRDVLQLKKSLEEARKDFVTMPRDQVVNFIDSIERGDMQSIPEKYRQLAQGLHTLFESDRLELQRLDPELLKNFYENYFPHIWGQSGKVARQMRAQAGEGKSLFGAGSFLKHRTIYPPTFKEGIALGLEPKTWNPVDMALMKHAEIQRYIFGLETVQRMKAEGLARFYKSANDAPPGWVPLDDRFATVTRRNDQGELVLMGHYYAPADAAKPFNNFVSRGLQGRSSALDAAFALNNSMNAVQLGLSAFHATASVLHSAVADVALGLQQMSQGRIGEGAAHIGRAAVPGLSAARAIRAGSLVGREYLDPGSAARYEAEAEWAARAGGRPEQSLTLTPPKWRQLTEDIRQRNWGRAGKGALPAALDAAGSWLMHGMVPRIKLGVFQDMAANILKEAGRNNWGDREVRAQMQKAWDAVDNRFGQMVYDNLFWHRTALDAARLGVRSVGWNLGSAREYGGGAADAARAFARAVSGRKPELTARTAFTLATPIYFAMATAVMDYLLTGHGPDEKKHGLAAYFFPEKADGTLMSFPGYMKDWYAFGHDPVGTAIHKASPMLTTLASMMQNKDYYGDKIRNVDDPMVRQAWDAAKYLGEQYVPFSVRSIQEQREKAGGGLLATLGGKSKGEMGVLGYAGFQPATLAVQDTPAMNLARHYEDEAPEAPRTAESREHGKEYRALVEGLREGNLDEQKLEEAFKSGKLNGRDWKRAKREAFETPLASAVSRLSLPQAVEVWKKATPEERAGLAPALRVKLANEAKTHPDLVSHLPQALLRGMAGVE